MDLVLNIYDDKGKEIVKTCEATTYDLMFGTVMNLMELLKIESVTNQIELLKIVHNVWGELTSVLNNVFPDITDEDWKHVKVKELLPVLISIVKFAVKDMLSIPTDSKN